MKRNLFMPPAKTAKPVHAPAAWIPSAPLTPMGKTFRSIHAQRVLPYTHRTFDMCLVNAEDRTTLIQWMATAYRLAAFNNKTPWVEMSSPLVLCTTTEGLDFTLWFVSVYLGRLLTSNRAPILHGHPQEFDSAYACVYLDLPSNGRIRNRIACGFQPFVELISRPRIFVGVTTLPKSAFPIGLSFIPEDKINVRSRRRLLLEMPVAARVLFDEPKEE